MTIDEVYSIMKYAIRNNQNGSLKPADFNLVINQAQISYLDFLLGPFQKYMPGRPFAAVEFGQNEDIRQRLTPFIAPPATLTIDGAGLSPYPTDFLAADAMYYGIYLRRIKYIQQDRLSSHYNSYIDPIGTNPIYLIQNNGLQFYPINLASAKFSYIGQPPALNWAFTEDIYRRPIYNSGASTQPLWYDTDMLQIIVRALAIVGVNLQLGVVQQYSQMIKTQGQ